MGQLIRFPIERRREAQALAELAAAIEALTLAGLWPVELAWVLARQVSRLWAEAGAAPPASGS